MNKHQARFHIIHSNKRKQSKQLAREEKKQQERINKDIVLRNLVNDYIKNIPHFFPNLMEQLMQIMDFRERPQYDIAQIVFSAIALFFFKATSRNAFNNLMSKRNFANNFKRAFGFLPPHFDTVALVMEKISNDDLEKLKSDMVIILIEKKIFYKYKVLGRFYNVAFDGSGVGSINPANLKNFPKALRKKYKSGITKFYLYVLEAKLICRNGLAVSIGSEWILNEKEDYDKQDCETKAAIRLMKKIKERFPRLSICVVADGLYPNNTIFTLCKEYHWEWIITLKDGNLKTVWEDINGLKKIEHNNQIVQEETVVINGENKVVTSTYSWVVNLEYMGHVLHYVDLIREDKNGGITKFAYITSLKPDFSNVRDLVEAGRLRFKIENEGFNTQKNLGYNLKHKFSRTSMNAVKNYYCVLQIAHMINQLFELSEKVKEFTRGRETIKSLWEFIRAIFSVGEILSEEIVHGAERKQVRLAS